MNMDIMHQSIKLIPIYLVKETKTRQIYFCIDEQNNFKLVFNTKTNFFEDFCTDFKYDFSVYNCYYSKNDDFYNAKNISYFEKFEYSNINSWLTILGEILFKIDNRYGFDYFEIIKYVKNSKDLIKNIYIIMKIILSEIYININFPKDFHLNKEYENIVFNNYDIIKSKVNYKYFYDVLNNYLCYLEDYGLELYNFRFIKRDDYGKEI